MYTYTHAHTRNIFIRVFAVNCIYAVLLRLRWSTNIWVTPLEINQITDNDYLASFWVGRKSFGGSVLLICERVTTRPYVCICMCVCLFVFSVSPILLPVKFCYFEISIRVSSVSTGKREYRSSGMSNHRIDNK